MIRATNYDWILHTDGSFDSSVRTNNCYDTAHGGWAYVLENGSLERESGAEHCARDACRMELMAVLKGLERTPVHTHGVVASDSEYVELVIDAVKHCRALTPGLIREIDKKVLRRMRRDSDITFELYHLFQARTVEVVRVSNAMPSRYLGWCDQQSRKERLALQC